MKPPLVRSCLALIAVLMVPRLDAQTGTGTITGVVNDPNHRALAGVVVQVADVRLGSYTSEDGRYTVEHVPAGAHKVIARLPGYLSDTVSVTITADRPVTQDFTLRPTSVKLQTVNITSPRLNETKAAALQEQKNSEQIVSVLSGDEIRSLPNSNAAEAAARMPGVTAERDEGEGKFVEVRGTPPSFTNVEIDGVHVPGTLNGDRSVKLDDVPSDLLGAIEVSKTLTADMDANAIGGTVNLVSKIPEGAPRGYIAGQAAYQTLENKANGQGSATYGGRIGDKQQFGFLLGGSYDRTNRILEDVEPSYTADEFTPQGKSWVVSNGPGFNHYYPSGWSEREYDYYRTRYGFDGNLDYRFTPTSNVYLRGLYSAFFDQANVWHTEVNGGTDVLQNGQYQVIQSDVEPNTSNRGPIEHTWGFIGGGAHLLGPVHLDWNATISGSSATSHSSESENYVPVDKSAVQSFTYTYGNNSRLVPRYFPTDPSVTAQIPNGSNYAISRVDNSNEGIDGENVGAGMNALIPYSIGDLPASFKFGVKYYNEHKSDVPTDIRYSYGGANTLANFTNPYTVSGYYTHICGGCYPLAPFGDIPAVQNALHANPGQFSVEDPSLIAFNNLVNNWSGTEQVSAAYAMQTLDVGQFHINAGVRVENTGIGYVAYNQDLNGDQTANTLLRIHQHHSYTDVFPDVMVKYALDENTNLRASFGRGIARPDYSSLIPTFAFLGAIRGTFTSGLQAGNPGLQPETSWNTDLLFEHYFPAIGVLSAGAFYKQINNFIFTREQQYTGQFIKETAYLPNDSGSFYISQPQNGPSAWEYGFEADYTQHMTFLPGAWRGIGFDVNWTWVYSRATVPIDDSTYFQCAQVGVAGCVNTVNGPMVFPYAGSNGVRHAPIPRQFPNMGNIALLYDYGPISARLAGQYTAASVYGYGQDGSSNPQSGDNWNYAHWQIDGSIVWTVWHATALQFQVLNLNDETFGFFNGNGTPGSGHGYNVQREYYGRTFWFGFRQGL